MPRDIHEREGIPILDFKGRIAAGLIAERNKTTKRQESVLR
jgi:hypothetical protein